MKDQFFQLVGEGAEPVSVVLVGVHGNERCGVEALESLLPSLKIKKGQVWFGYGNPRAIQEDKRFIEVNLNRMFKDESMLSGQDRASYEYERALVIKGYLNQAGALLDVHASFTPDSRPFVICENNAKGLVEFLPIDLVVSGFDQVEPGGTDYYMNSQGKIGMCLECGYLGDDSSTELAKQGIVAFLRARGHLDGDLPTVTQQSHVRMYDLYISKTSNFSLSKVFADFEEIETGQIIGTDGDIEVRAQKPSVILFARNRDRVGEEAFLLGEKKNSLA